MNEETGKKILRETVRTYEEFVGDPETYRNLDAETKAFYSDYMVVSRVVEEADGTHSVEIDFVKKDTQ